MSDEEGRLLFRYLTGDEWRDHRAIMATFAGTFFSEFSPDEVTARLADAGHPLDAAIVADRLESLRRWGNLTVSSATGEPASLADYYRRRNRYLITRGGQEVHDLAEGVLSRVDQVGDVSTSRLRAVLAALRDLQAIDVPSIDAQRLADMVAAVFDPYQAFTSEISQFFADLNRWQNRYDLTPDEFGFFASVLVGYVADRLDDIERASRPIASCLRALGETVPLIVGRVARGLAGAVEQAGLGGAVAVTTRPGTSAGDWALLAGWFVPSSSREARIDRLRGEAVAAVRTLTLNLVRLSRTGIGASSRRGDLLRLAAMVAGAPSGDHAATLLAAALGLHPARHLGLAAADDADPVATTTSWWHAPAAPVPVSLRERGDTAARGVASPLADRSAARRELERRRESTRQAAARVDVELLAAGPLDGAKLSAAALRRLQLLVGRAVGALPVTPHTGGASAIDGGIVCHVRRAPDQCTRVADPHGTLTFVDLQVAVAAAGG
ncbi:MAG TPA: TIGR02677 family protein [Acidimicrobiales bacterium]|nr:TIGR02677 family protein [Acidimicrobiales bacterium]